MKADTCSRAIDKKGRGDQTVLVIGGSGGMSNRYRDVVEKHGWSLRHYENRLPPGARRSAGKIALVVIMVSMVSHSLREQVRTLSLDDAPVVYLRSASVSALREAIEQRIG
jgi:UDP-N-acetylglucosamine:LPS N-acetylglucosamine transferase